MPLEDASCSLAELRSYLAWLERCSDEAAADAEPELADSVARPHPVLALIRGGGDA